jgi:hypothetical protein
MVGKFFEQLVSGGRNLVNEVVDRWDKFVKPEPISPYYQIPTPTPAPTPTPTPAPTPAEILGQQEQTREKVLGAVQPTPTPTYTPTPTPTPITSLDPNISYEERPYADLISQIWQNQQNIAHEILRYTDPEGVIRGENTGYEAGPEMDIPNRINPVTGKWDPNAPIATFPNPFTDEEEQSIDRGLFRINKERFLDFLAGKDYRQEMYNRGIIPEPHLRWEGLTPQKVSEYWDLMLDPLKNIQMAKLIYEINPESWYGANPTSGARLY